jgi:hypothetical protein
MRIVSGGKRLNWCRLEVLYTVSRINRRTRRYRIDEPRQPVFNYQETDSDKLTLERMLSAVASAYDFIKVPQSTRLLVNQQAPKAVTYRQRARSLRDYEKWLCK